MLGDLEHPTNNANHEALKGFVDRLFNIERDFADVKGEYTDSVKDLKTEIKSNADETGVSVKQVVELVKIRLNEQAAIDEQEERDANMELYRSVYGFSAAPASETADEEDDVSDDDALG